MSQLKKWIQVRKKGQKLEKCVTVRKMCHSHKNVSQLEKCVSLRNVAQG